MGRFDPFRRVQGGIQADTNFPQITTNTPTYMPEPTLAELEKAERELWEAVKQAKEVYDATSGPRLTIREKIRDIKQREAIRAELLAEMQQEAK